VKRIGILTSGGDAPGMNACVRSIVKIAVTEGYEVLGFERGYEGILDKSFMNLDLTSVANIIHRGGTILKTARSKRFYEEAYRSKAAQILRELNVEFLITIGGDGTFTGAKLLASEHGVNVLGIPGTIDNDLFGTDYTLGYDTAINTVVEAVDKIRDTAISHDRFFVIEVMGKDAGFIALRSGIASGAEAVLVPEESTIIDDLINQLQCRRKNKQSAIIIVAEGDDFGGGRSVKEHIEKEMQVDVKLTVLGHIQRGGAPSAMDRVLAAQYGAYAMECVKNDISGIMVGIENGTLNRVPLASAIKHHQKVKEELISLSKRLSV